MSRRRLAFAPAAVADWQQIRDDTCEHWDDAQWSVYSETLRRAFMTLLDHPAIGGELTHLGLPGRRRHLAGRHLIIFRDDGDAHVVLRLAYERSDWIRVARVEPGTVAVVIDDGEPDDDRP
jgi:plasmid stabilization system protein ParE